MSSQRRERAPSVDERLPAHVTREQVLERAERAESVLEMQRYLRLPRERTSPLLRDLGVWRDVAPDEDELLRAAAEELGIDRDATIDEFGGGSQ